jgi:penicillin-binding protein 1A
VQIRRRVFKESTAWLLVDVLFGCVTPEGTGYAANFDNFSVAGKTGTNSDYRGVFFAGMTGYYAGAVWIGSDDYDPLVSGASGGTYAAPLWGAVMKAAHSYKGITVDQPIRSKSAADVGLIKVEICSVSGMLPTSACENDVNGYGTTVDYFLSGTEPVLKCNMHRSVRLCTRTYKAPTSDCDTERYGVIYMPEGHPLRTGVSTVVQHYFSGVSTSKETAEISKCTICSKRFGFLCLTYGGFGVV